MNSRLSVFYRWGIAVLCGILLFFLWYDASNSGGSVPKFGMSRFGAANVNEGYAILVMDESQDDRGIHETLTHAGIGGIISESSQFVPIDDFGALKQVPLESFHDEIEAFDPRNDGYAEKLHSFFVNNGNRYFFTSLENNSANLRAQLGASLKDISFTLILPEQRRSFLRYFILLAAAGIFALYLSRSRKLFMFQVPVFLSLGWGGFAAMILAAVLAGIWELLREPLKELFTARYSHRETYSRGTTLNYSGAGLKGITERLKPYRLNVFLAILFLLMLPVLAAAGFFPPIPLLASCVSFFLLYFLSFRTMADNFRKSRHIPFLPVPLLPQKTRTFSFFPFLLPFILGSFLALILPVFLPEQNNDIPVHENFMEPRYFVTPEDYNRHIDFQRSFSYRPLNGAAEALNQEGYLRYYLGDDGLIEGSADYAGTGEVEVLPFPLEKLMDFLIHYYEPLADQMEITEPVNPPVREWMLAFFVLAFCCISELLRPGIVSGKKLPIRWDKRITA